MLIHAAYFFTADHTPYAMISTETDKEVYDVLVNVEGQTFLRVNNRLVDGFTSKQKNARKLLNAAIRVRGQMLALVHAVRFDDPSASASEFWALREAVKAESLP